MYSLNTQRTNYRFNEIIVRISYPKEIRGTKANVDDDLKLKPDDNLKNAFKQYRIKKK